MSTRKKLENYRKGGRKPDPRRLVETKPTKGRQYKAVSIAFSPEHYEWLDEMTAVLQTAGRSGANRSVVIREAIYVLQNLLKGKKPADIRRFFSEQELRRSE